MQQIEKFEQEKKELKKEYEGSKETLSQVQQHFEKLSENVEQERSILKKQFELMQNKQQNQISQNLLKQQIIKNF